MKRVIHWGDVPRQRLVEELPEAIVVLAIGAIEQHGPYLPTTTDILIASRVATAGAHLAVERGTRTVIIAPPLPFGISGHHRAFGGTLSLEPRTMLAVLEDLVDSIERQGGRRLIIVNGHGGNRGIARAVASAADARASITVAAVDYWDLGAASAPGHAGEVETSLVLAIAPELVATPIPPRDAEPTLPSIGPASYHGAWVWQGIDGYTDDPSRADVGAGQALISTVVDGLADLIVSFGRLPA